MSFSSLIFLTVFFPVVITVYRLSDKKYQNAVLCFASVAFYAWSGLKFLVVAMGSTLVAYLVVLLISRTEKEKWKRFYLILGIAFSVGVLIFYKYIPVFVNQPKPLPLGISFYTFSLLSYMLDCYWEKCEKQKSFFNLLLYVLMFPKVVQGPIMRYPDFQTQLENRQGDLSQMFAGLERFIKGMVKKTLIADQLAPIVNMIFADVGNINTFSAWIGIIGYLLQLYYDFSGYSDMAIGIGKMLGYELPLNFDHPYMAETIAEYWRRWHISLGDWFRDYVYVPASRFFIGRKNPFSQKKLTIFSCDLLALFVTWSLVGIWHGAGLVFFVYGLWWYLFIFAERVWNNERKKYRKKKGIKGKVQKSRLEIFVNHFITIFAVILGQVLFRTMDFQQTWHYIKALFSFQTQGWQFIYLKLNASILFTFIAGIIFCFPVYQPIKEKAAAFCSRSPKLDIGGRVFYGILLLSLFAIVFLYITSTDFVPFLYQVF